MERRDQVKVKSGKEYDHLFPRAMLTSITKKEGATVADTIKFIPQVVRDTLFHTKKIALVLKGDSVPETCRNIWQFVYDHIAYKKDEDGKEQIRSPARAWHDRGNIQGVDCDCYTTFISSILSNLKIRHLLRITKYKEDRFQHIYPIVPLSDVNYITIDCVVREFDYEEPYSEKKDTQMDLEYLNGVYDSTENKNTDQLDLIGVYDDREAMSDLGKLFKKGGLKKIVTKVKTVAKKAIHVLNRVNPATAVLRAGVLASAKLNVFKIASRIKYAYLTNAEAQKRGIDMDKFARLKKVRERLEQIFHGLGGKPENLKKAILTGKGNKNKEVNGLGYIPDMMDGINEHSSISQILGTEMYQDELSGVFNGLGSLGEPATAASVAAATGILGAIAGLLKSIGNIFPKKSKESQDFEEEGATPAPAEIPDSSASVLIETEPAIQTATSTSSSGGSGGSSSNGSAASSAAQAEESPGAELPVKRPTQIPSEAASTDSADSGSETKPDAPVGFWAKHKKWLLPTSIGTGVLILSYVGYRVMKKDKPNSSNTKPALSGIPKSKKKKRKGGRSNFKSKNQKKQAVALL
ncbi:MAG: hypothetical protein ACT4ON_13270 [Bacteroidota bacterium]